ncbi:MAG: cbb3-type cytochrome oxidase assembly protein CcoS [Alphaproteobacteria bacterium]
MNNLLMLIPVALGLGLLGLLAFLWALRSGQFEDLDGAANRILFDDDPVDRDDRRSSTREGREPR